MNLKSATQRAMLIVLALFGLLPYISAVKLPPVPSFWAEWTCALLAGALVLLLRAPGAGEPRPSGATRAIPMAAGVIALAALWILLQWAVDQSRFGGGALLAVLELSLAAALCITAARWRAGAGAAAALDAWAWGLFGALLVNLVVVVIERIGLQVNAAGLLERDARGRALGLLGQPNHLAVFAVLAWCATLHLWLRRRLGLLPLLGFAAGVGFVLAGAASRAGAVLWVSATGLCWLATRRAERGGSSTWALAGAAALFLLGHAGWLLGDRGAVPATTVLRANANERVELLRDAWQLVSLHPLAGVGYGNFRAARWTELSAPMAEPNAEHAHNLGLHLAAELGVAGALLILLPLAWCVLLALRGATRRGAASESFLVAAVLLVLAGYSLVEYPLWYTYFLLPCAFALGLVEQPAWRLRRVQARPMKVVAALASLLMLGVWTVLAWDYRRLETLYTKAVQRQADAGGTRHTLELPVVEVRKIALLTAYDTYATQMLARTLLPNGKFMLDKVPITERAMLAFVNWESVARHMVFLAGANQFDEARQVWAKTERSPELRRETQQALWRMAPTSPGLEKLLQQLDIPPASQAEP